MFLKKAVKREPHKKSRRFELDRVDESGTRTKQPVIEVGRVQGEPEQRTKTLRESESPIRAMKPGNGKALGPDGAKGARAKKEPQEGNATAAQTAEVASTGLLGIGKVAKQNPNLRFKALAHHLTVGLLAVAFS